MNAPHTLLSSSPNNILLFEERMKQHDINNNVCSSRFEYETKKSHDLEDFFLLSTVPYASAV